MYLNWCRNSSINEMTFRRHKRHSKTSALSVDTMKWRNYWNDVVGGFFKQRMCEIFASQMRNLPKNLRIELIPFKGWTSVKLLVILLKCFVGTISQTLSQSWQWENQKNCIKQKAPFFNLFWYLSKQESASKCYISPRLSSRRVAAENNCKQPSRSSIEQWKNPSCSGHYTTQSYGDCNKPLSNNQYNGT